MPILNESPTRFIESGIKTGKKGKKSRTHENHHRWISCIFIGHYSSVPQDLPPITKLLIVHKKNQKASTTPAESFLEKPGLFST